MTDHTDPAMDFRKWLAPDDPSHATVEGQRVHRIALVLADWERRGWGEDDGGDQDRALVRDAVLSAWREAAASVTRAYFEHLQADALADRAEQWLAIEQGIGGGHD
jgi:hypothetical protein